MKKLVSLVLCLLMTAAMVTGCGAKKSEPAAPSTPAPEQPAAQETPAVEEWKPASTVEVIVGFAAGGGMDSLARAVA